MSTESTPNTADNGNSELIAIVGIGCRPPGGINKPSDLWDLLCAERTAVPFDSSRLNPGGFYHPDFQRPGGFNTEGACLLDEDPRLLDHGFFGMSTTQVMSMDLVPETMIVSKGCPICDYM